MVGSVEEVTDGNTSAWIGTLGFTRFVAHASLGFVPHELTYEINRTVQYQSGAWGQKEMEWVKK